MIKVGEKLPEGFFRIKDDIGNAVNLTTDELFAGQRVVLVGVPGAFTSTCHKSHIPQFVATATEIKAKGVDRIAVMAVNDHHVMKVWEDALGGTGKIDFLSDGSAIYTKALGMDVDRTEAGMGIRARRFSMIVDDGIVRAINLEPDGSTTVAATGAQAMLEQL
jgi:glutaredoxin/glutathione-dependent peroxiredoxin